VDLVKPVREQIGLMRELNLRGTFLIQYDALIMPEFSDLLKSLDPRQFEIGVWFEIVQPQVEAAGIKWRGRFPWDWHVHCGFAPGYTQNEREKCADVLYEKFREIFGYYPRVFGSWLFDTYTVNYISDKYGMDALCNCKEQYGTDGYTLWGGYYGQGYYPSRTNVFMPAVNEQNQLRVPLFRMLGSDPVYQYDFGMDPESGAQRFQGVITLEPVYKGGGGGVPRWVDWYLRENYNGECLSFGYAQAGQENSFGWDDMKYGLTYQFRTFAKLRDEGKLEIEPLGETGRWFKDTYKSTPPSVISAHTAYDDPSKGSLWYSSAFYRTNLFRRGNTVYIRDLHIFSENMADPYYDTVCTKNEAAYETLPVIDGNRHSGSGIAAGAYISFDDGSLPVCEDMRFSENDDGSASVDCCDIRILLHDKGIRITADKEFCIRFKRGNTRDHFPVTESISRDSLTLRYADTVYGIRLLCGSFASDTEIVSDGCCTELFFN